MAAAVEGVVTAGSADSRTAGAGDCGGMTATGSSGSAPPRAEAAIGGPPPRLACELSLVIALVLVLAADRWGELGSKLGVGGGGKVVDANG